MAWLDIAVAEAQGDKEILLRRAKWWNSIEGGGRDCVLLDCELAIARWPDEPECWEARGQQLLHDDGYLTDDTSGYADFARAVGLRVASGEVAGDAQSLRERGDACKAGYDFNRNALAHACYTVAIDQAPGDATLYLARARAISWNDVFSQHPAAHLKLSFDDTVRALSLDKNLDEARVQIVEYLVQTLTRPTAHERMEALLQARQSLMDAGVAPALANEIIGEVERALAA